MALMMGLMMLVSCNKEKQSSKEAVFTADIEQLAGQQGRTSINPENGMVKWLAGDKIMIANVREYDFEEVSVEIERLIDASYHMDAMNIVALMKDMVPEFKSLNSPYSILDTGSED